jgi:hypothetical protein
VTFHIPVLALTATALPLVYVLSRYYAPSVFVDFAVAEMMAVALLWASVRGDSWTQRVIAIVGNLLLPIFFMAAGFRGHVEIGRHGYALLILNGLAWLPALMVQEITGPLLVHWHGDPKANPLRSTQVGSCILVILTMVVATLVFAGRAIDTEAQGGAVTVILFAIPFYLVCFTLISLARLLRRTYERPGRPLAISGALMTRWGASLLALLVACTVLALLLPKFPFHGGSAASERTRRPQSPSWLDRLPTRPGPSMPGQRTSDTPADGDNRPGATRPNGRGQGRPDGTKPGDGKSSESGKGTTQDGKQSTGNGEGKSGGSQGSGKSGDGQGTGSGKSGGGQGTGNGGQGSGGGGQGSGGQHGTSPRDPLAPPPAQTAVVSNDPWHLRAMEAVLNLAIRTAYLGEEGQIAAELPGPFSAEIRARLREKATFLGTAIRNNPLRLIKLLVVLLLPVSLVYSIIRTVRGSRRRAATAAGLPGSLVPPPDPFADPFPALEGLPADEQAARIYASFLAYCWLRDYVRRPEQTEYEFAVWLEYSTHLDNQAVWTLTRCCTQVRYAGASLTPDDLAQARAAWEALRAQILDGLPEAVRLTRMAAFRTRGIPA